MGHIRLGVLPRTHRWKHVIELLQQGTPVDEIARATYWAAYHGLEQVPSDEGFTQTLTTIFGFIDAVQSKNPAAALRERGFDVPSNPSLLDLVGSFQEKSDSAAASVRAKSDIASIAQESFARVVVKAASPAAGSLFGPESANALRAAQASFKGKQLGEAMHEFFATFTQRYLDYHLGREVPCHVGAGKALFGLSNHSEFNQAFDLYVRQTVRIADEFTPGWFGKAKWEGRLTHKDVSQYAHVAFKKIRSQFKRGAEESD